MAELTVRVSESSKQLADKGKEITDLKAEVAAGKKELAARDGELAKTRAQVCMCVRACECESVRVCVRVPPLCMGCALAYVVVHVGFVQSVAPCKHFFRFFW